MAGMLAGAARIIAADVNPAKLELATSFGATDVVDSSHEDVVDAVRELTGGGVDYAFEVIGLTHTVEQSVRAVRVGGTAVAVGIVPPGPRHRSMSSSWSCRRRRSRARSKDRPGRRRTSHGCSSSTGGGGCRWTDC